MKLKAFSLIAGAIALTLTATSFAVEAQTASPSPVLLAQTPHQGNRLNLTEAQKGQIKIIHQNTWQQIEDKVFTPSQKAQFESAKQARKAAWEARKAQGQTGQQQTGERRHHRGGRGMFAKLNLTQAQKDQIKQIRQSEREQIKAVLTPEQQQQIQQWHQNHKKDSPESNPG
ncbi:P pilus assembly/Cpx signaling pathway, periplasmic inhibitor/zinc-resistance associated protein [Nostoc sp. KVJ3]|uniref:P pilus assembly/Cpx signaling pathway, periplasmic inhibitor/zinc-resistance associated protein n=1 Tax=Nostoc sp. KVJ3 TaxID=457945 RepID=UPI0022384D19|nr:P pilus assembly/Cpx signaling pathway, periplasmic inhibitor/zinc-resistance associated protein [Nostoc sp. KVJ3]MCW5313501.1 P pilus assembly/Cpx signaling pathway, periplasmic inhibitor/zinc-resistance associated protein [Nostoc sp. KVJ3]